MVMNHTPWAVDNMKERSAERVVGITDYFVSLPPTKYLIIAIVLLGFIFGLIINFGKYNDIDLILKGSVDGILLLSIPALVSSIVIKLMIKKISFKRVVATTLVGEIIYTITYAASFFLSSYNPSYGEMIVLLGAGIAFILWYAVARLIFILRFRSILFAVIQLLFHLIFLLSSSKIYVSDEPIFSIAKFYVAAFVLLVAMFIFFFIVNRPLKKSFGISSTDAFSHVVGQWLYQDNALEKTFESVGQDAKTLLTLFSFKRKNDNIFLVVPNVHFGPFGTLGGSEFSHLIANGLSARYKAKALVFHGTATHDLNPVSSKELDKVLDACDACLKNAKYENANIAFLSGNEQECNAEALLINNNVFVGLTRAPLVTEDINFGVGLSIINEAEKTVSIAAIADQHNSETGEIVSFEPGDKVSYNYIRSVNNALSKKPKFKSLKIGYAERYFDYKFIGKAGIKVLVFSSMPEYVLVLVDSNGVAPDFRDKLISEIKDVGKKYNKNWQVGVYTTDTHQINVVRGVRNPLRDEISLVEEIKAAVVEAMLDMQSAQFYAAKKWFDIRVIGPRQSIEIVSTLNATISLAKFIAPLILIGGIAAVLLILRKIG